MENKFQVGDLAYDNVSHSKCPVVFGPFREGDEIAYLIKGSRGRHWVVLENELKTVTEWEPVPDPENYRFVFSDGSMCQASTPLRGVLSRRRVPLD